MKIAIIDHVGNPGGGCRYLRALVPHLLKIRPDLQITYFGNAESIEREGLREEWEPLGIKIRKLFSLWLVNRNFFGFKGAKLLIKILQQRYSKSLSFLPHFLSGSVHRELEMKLKGFDLLFFPWPYFLQCPRIDIPKVAVFHDFNFRYNFFGAAFSPLNFEILSRDIPIWLNDSVPVVSTYFMKCELEKFYPEQKSRAHVIHLAPMSAMSNMSREKALSLISGLNIPSEYVLYPTNITPHKNIGPLLSAFYYLKLRGCNTKLVLVGYGTESINGRVGKFGIEYDSVVKDVYGLGYVSNEQIDALIQCAKVVVSTSVYEAGNGPGLDAWGKGIPVAMSDIPAFTEHLEVQGVKAKVFDPRSPEDIANKIEELLNNPDQALADAQASLNAISDWNWEVAARKYLDVFDEALKARV